MLINRFEFNVINSNMYIIIEKGTAIIIDPNENIQAKQFLDSEHIKDVVIFLTHEHFDHISGVNYFKDYNITVCSNFACKRAIENHFREIMIQFASIFVGDKSNRREMLCNLQKKIVPVKVDKVLYDNDVLRIGIHNFRIKETPGHSEGSICIIMDDYCIFTGDSLLPDYKVETRLQGGSKEDYEAITLPFLKSLNRNLVVYPGHGEESVLGKLLDEQ